MGPVEDLLHQGKAAELIPDQQGEDLVGEDFLDDLIMEMSDMVKGAIRGCPSLGHQDMDMKRSSLMAKGRDKKKVQDKKQPKKTLKEKRKVKKGKAKVTVDKYGKVVMPQVKPAFPSRKKSKKK